MPTLRSKLPDKPRNQWYFVVDQTVTDGVLRLYYTELPDGEWYGAVYTSRHTYAKLMSSEQSIRKLAEGQRWIVMSQAPTTVAYVDMDPGESVNPMVVTEKMLREVLSLLSKGEDIGFLYPVVMGMLADHEEMLGKLRALADLVGEAVVRTMEMDHAV